MNAPDSPSALGTGAPVVGVLALQGDVREHFAVLAHLGSRSVKVRRPEELEGLDGLVIPGGESTTIDKLARAFGITEPLRGKIREGFPVYGSCAGMIMLADEIADPTEVLSGRPQESFGGLDITVRRNAFGRQRESFETDLDFKEVDQAGGPVHAVFIRGPWVERVGSDVEVLAEVDPAHASHTAALEGRSRIVAVRSGRLLATSFHPEVTGETRIHELFIRMIRGEA
nr:pyridoxal 5'-phosphate synthase glutaminase subunit PdxT [Sinomonas notoginsengisoli]